jgi:hypothetical protein
MYRTREETRRAHHQSLQNNVWRFDIWRILIGEYETRWVHYGTLTNDNRPISDRWRTSDSRIIRRQKSPMDETCGLHQVWTRPCPIFRQVAVAQAASRSHQSGECEERPDKISKLISE